MPELSAVVLERVRKFFEDRGGASASSSRVFLSLLSKFLTEPAHIDWNAWRPLSSEIQRDLSSLPDAHPVEVSELLRRLVVLRLNGGLGTTMGCAGAKSSIEVRDGLSFLEIALRQHETLEKEHGVKVPLLLMNSFNTDEETRAAVGARATSFCQSRCPRLDEESLQPLPEEEDAERWYPPGHGNVFVALQESGLLPRLLSEGRDILFISNIDNTGAEPSIRVAKLMADEEVEYAMECTEKTQADLKGGTLIDIAGVPMHLEMPQVPPEHLDEFCSTRVFKLFNTNNIWVNLRAVESRVYDITSEIIVNRKKTSTGRKVLQLETSIGGAIRNFKKAYCVTVPRARFIPVKGTPDLLAVCSDLYKLDDDFCLRLQAPLPPPRISLSSHFQTVGSLHTRFPVWPSLQGVRSLNLDGDILFEGPVTFEGDVSLSSAGKATVPSNAEFRDEAKNLE